MILNETILSSKLTNYVDVLVSAHLVDMVNTYYYDSFLSVKEIKPIIQSEKFGTWHSNGLNFSIDFRKKNRIIFKADCSKFTIHWNYEFNQDFPNGFHTITIDEKENNQIIKAFLKFIDLFKEAGFSGTANIIKVGPDEKPYVILDLNYYQRNSKGETATIAVDKKGVHWGYEGKPQLTMSAVSSAGGTLTFEQFLSGQNKQFVYDFFDEKTFNEITKNVLMRQKTGNI